MVGAIPPAPRYEHVHIQQMPQRLLPDLREVCEPFPGGFHREPRQIASPFEDSSARHRTPCATHGFLWRERGFSLAPQKLRDGQPFPPCAFADQPGPVIADFQGEGVHVLPYDKIAHQGIRGSRLTAQDIVSCGTRNAFQQEVKTPADISLRNGLKPREMPEASQECSRCVARNATTGRFPEGTQLVASRWRLATPPAGCRR
jgi:hypothetical protein